MHILSSTVSLVNQENVEWADLLTNQILCYARHALINNEYCRAIMDKLWRHTFKQTGALTTCIPIDKECDIVPSLSFKQNKSNHDMG